MASSKKVSEGVELIQQAEKYLKTSFLKWKPDYELAADAYNKAATCFKNAKELVQCRDCLYKAADCYKQTKSYFSAAKSLDQATLILKEMQEWKEISQTAHRACQFYQEHGSPDTAALMLDKAAKMIEGQLPEEALMLYKRAMEVVMLEDRPRQAAEYASRASRLMVKLQRYDEACDILAKEIGYHSAGDNSAALGRVLVALVLVQLAREDVVAAGKVIQEWGNCCEQEELEVAMQLHQAFDSEDGQQAQQALANPFIRHMDVEYSRLATTMKLPEGLSRLENVTQTATKMESLNMDDIRDIDDDELENEYFGSRENTNTTQEKKGNEEDEFEEGLC